MFYSDLCQCWVFMSGTLEILYWQMRVKLDSCPMRGWVTRKQWRLAEIPVWWVNVFKSVSLESSTHIFNLFQWWDFSLIKIWQVDKEARKARLDKYITICFPLPSIPMRWEQYVCWKHPIVDLVLDFQKE